MCLSCDYINKVFTFQIVVLCLAIASSSAAPSLLLGGAATLIAPGAPGAVIKGPAAQSTAVGPDGSVVAGAADAGAVIAAPKPGGAISAAVAPGGIAIGVPGLIAPAAHLGLGLPLAGGIIAGPAGAIVSHGLGAGLIAPGIIGHGW